MRHLIDMKWGFLSVILLAAGCSHLPFTPPEPSRAPEEIVFRFLHDHPDGEAAALARRLGEDKSLHAILSLPETRRVDGALLDPDSVIATWNGRPLPAHMYYKAPTVGLFFILPGDDILAAEPEGILRVEASLLGERSRGVLFGARVFLTGADLENRGAAAGARRGQQLRLEGGDGGPVEGAWIFGQRREDLVARTDARGIVLLDAPARSSAPIHYAWADGYWTERFDPVRRSAVTMTPRRDARRVSVTLRPEGPDGGRVEEGLLLVGDDYFHHWTWGRSGRLRVPVEDVPALLLAPGYEKYTTTIDAIAEDGTVTLTPLD